MQHQAGQGIFDLLLSLMVRSSSNVLFLALTRPDCPQVVDVWPCRKAVMYKFFPLTVLQHQQTILLAPWGCVVQDMFSYTLAVSNAEAILLLFFFFFMWWLTQLISMLMFTLYSSASLLCALSTISLNIVVLLPLMFLVEEWDTPLSCNFRFCKCRLSLFPHICFEKAFKRWTTACKAKDKCR